MTLRRNVLILRRLVRMGGLVSVRAHNTGREAVVGRFFGSLIFLVVASALFCLHADAQQSGGLLSEQLQRAQSQAQGASGQGQGTSRETVLLQPTTPSSANLPASRLEQILSTRAGVKLKQFGYDQLGVGRAVTIPQMGAVQDDYVLGPGDEIVVSLRGQENAEYRAVVDRDGRVMLPRINPVSASGRTLGDFRRELMGAIHRSYISTEGYVSVGLVRQINVLVSGEVNSPGVRILSGLSNAVDAILVSGGVKKSGSLRNVRILRGGRTITLDLYSVLTGQSRGNKAMLAEGDRIVVPSLGPTVAVAGWVRRPGIYEMTSGRSSLDLAELLSLAGGLEVRGKYRISMLEVAADGSSQLKAIEGGHSVVRDSDIVFVQPAASQTVGKATLSGGTALAGQYSTRNTKLSEILKAPGALGDNPYTLFGVISRRDSVSLLRVLIPFTPVAVLRGADDMNIQSDDIVRVMSAKEAKLLLLTLSQYEERRGKVEDALRSPDSVIPQLLDTQVSSTAAQTGQTQGQSQPNRASSNEAQQDLGSETEAESLRRVEHDIEVAFRRANGIYPYGQFGPYGQYSQQNAFANTNQNAGQYAGTQQQTTSDAQYGNTRPDMTGMQDQGIQNTQQGGQYLPPQSMNQLSQQVGPYSDPRNTYGSPATLGQNFEEQSIAAGQVPTNQDVSKASQLANQLEIDPVVFVNFLRDHQVVVGGAVQGAGNYLVGPDADIQALLQAAGGLLRWSDKNAIEVISTTVDSASGTSKTQRNTISLADPGTAGYIVSPHDEVRVSQIVTAVGGGQVVVQGQVHNTGTYQIARGEHLSDILTRAGGLTANAYPYGTVFLRRSVAAQEKEAFRREADELQTQLMIAMSRREADAKLSPDAFNALQSYVNQLRYQKALGRITVAADPAVLAANPSLDPLLEAGDIIYIPQRPYAISIFGEVLQPGSVPFKVGMSASDYVNRAGGYSQFADKSETFLVLPDGTARHVNSSWFNIASDDIPPGSTIFVSRDVSGFDVHAILLDATTIFSQLATTAAALAVLSKQ